MTRQRTLIVGIGSPHGDDQAGWLAADRLAGGRLSPRLSAGELSVRKAPTPAAVLDFLERAGRLLIVDACLGPGAVGEVCRWSWPDATLDQARWAGTHDMSLPAVLRLAQRLRQLPAEVAIYSITAGKCAPLSPPSPAVLAALDELEAAVADELEKGMSRRRHQTAVRRDSDPAQNHERRAVPPAGDRPAAGRRPPP